MADKEVNIVISEKALKYIQSKKLKEPLIVAIMGSRSGDGGCEGDGGCGGGGGGNRGGGGGCGGEGSDGSSAPCVNTVLANGGNPGTGFVRIDTQAGIPVYLSKAVFNRAKRSSPLLITVKGAVSKRLNLEGLDLSAAAGEADDEEGGQSCH